MATYEENKREAIGMVDEPADPFAADETFWVSKPTKVPLGISGHIINYNNAIKEQIDKQSSLKTALSRWDEEYDKDKKQSAKNYTELKEYLQMCDTTKAEMLLSGKPAVDWLNGIFLEKAEIDDLMNFIKNTSPECKEVIQNSIRKELEKLVRFKAVFEQILLIK